MNKNWGGLDMLTSKFMKEGLSENNAFKLAASLNSSNFENAIRNDKLFQKILERYALKNRNNVNSDNVVNIANKTMEGALQEYFEIQSKFINIFQKACNQRSEEHSLANTAKKATQKLINTGLTRNNAENKAFKNLRTKKNINRNYKIDLHIELLELSEELKELFNNDYKNVEKMLSKSKLFKNFIKENPQCKKLMKWKNQNTGNYEGLKDYLGSATRRAT